MNKLPVTKITSNTTHIADNVKGSGNSLGNNT